MMMGLLHARGAGTGVSGDALGPGLVLDFSYSMRRVVDTGADTVRVQPGVVLANLNRELAQVGRLIGPDPSTRSVTICPLAKACRPSDRLPVEIGTFAPRPAVSCWSTHV